MTQSRATPLTRLLDDLIREVTATRFEQLFGEPFDDGPTQTPLGLSSCIWMSCSCRLSVGGDAEIVLRHGRLDRRHEIGEALADAGARLDHEMSLVGDGPIRPEDRASDMRHASQPGKQGWRTSEAPARTGMGRTEVLDGRPAGILILGPGRNCWAVWSWIACRASRSWTALRAS